MTCPHLAAGTGPGLLSSSQLFTLEGLIEKTMSPGCECVAKTGAEVASRGGGRAGRSATRMGGWEPNAEGTHKEGGLALGLQALGPGRGDISLGEEEPPGGSRRAGPCEAPGRPAPMLQREAERRVCERGTAGCLG